MAVALKATEAAARVTGAKDTLVLIDWAETYCAIGDKSQAKEYARKAVEAAAGSPPN